MSSRAWQFYLADMLKFSQRVVIYTQGFDRDRFVESGLTYDATLRNLELIGEAASRVPTDAQIQMPQSHGVRSSQPAIVSFMVISGLITTRFGALSKPMCQR